MMNRFSKIALGGGYLKLCIAISQVTVCSYATIDQQELSAIKNKLVYVDWAATAANKIADAKDGVFYKEKPRKVSKYRESIINVIGHAIADCVTMQKEFAEKENGQPRVITFKANPLGFARRHWNAAIIYELVDYIIHNKRFHKGIALSRSSETICEEVWDAIKEDLTQAYADKNVPDLEYKLERSIEDIKQYDKELRFLVICQWNQEGIVVSQRNEELSLASTQITDKELKLRISRGDYTDGVCKLDIKRVAEIKPTPNCTIGLDLQLEYKQANSAGEKWNLADSARSEIKLNNNRYARGFRGMALCWDLNVWNWLLQFVECDLELDATNLRDYKYWKMLGPVMEYHGKSKTINSFNYKDDQYHVKFYEDLVKEVPDFQEQYYQSYKSIDPKKRPLKVDD